MGEPVGTLRRARQCFAGELARLDVVLDERAVLDALLDEMADQIGVSRSTLVSTYLTEDVVVGMAGRAATETTGWDPALHVARQLVMGEHPEAAGWPDPVRNYLIDHINTRTSSQAVARAYLGDVATVEEVGLLRFGYRLRADLADELGPDGADATIPVVTVQHRDLVERPGPLRADPGWGRPGFEWAYELMRGAYRRRTGTECARLVWAWADFAISAAAHRPDLAGPDARDHLAALAEPDTVIVVARIPVDRCLATSHILWDGAVLRGRYIPLDIDDAVRFHGRHGSCRLDDDHRSDLSAAVIDSWADRLFPTGADWSEVRLQVCADRIEPDEIVDILDVARPASPRLTWMPDPGVKPERLHA